MLAAPATEIFVGDNASVRFVSAQTWGKGVYHIGSQCAKVGRDGNMEWVGLNLGGKLQHVEAETSLEGNGSRVDWVAAITRPDAVSTQPTLASRSARLASGKRSARRCSTEGCDASSSSDKGPTSARTN